MPISVPTKQTGGDLVTYMRYDFEKALKASHGLSLYCQTLQYLLEKQKEATIYYGNGSTPFTRICGY